MSAIAPVSRVTAAFVAELNANFAYLDRQVGIYTTPEAYGALGNGVTDDSAAFQAAINVGGALVLDSSKTYALKGIVIDAASTCTAVLSLGGGANIVPAVGSDINTKLFTITKHGVTFDNLTFTMPISTVDGVRPLGDRPIYFVNADDCTVTNCDFIGGRFGPYFGGICKYFYCANNRITQTYGQAISADSPNSFEIVDNICHVGGYSTADSSGAIRIGGIGSQAEIISNGIIARNIVRYWNTALNQEAIDLSAQAVRNLLVTDNVIEGCGNGGFQLKTGPSALSPNVFQNVMISNNVVRLLSSGGIGITLHFAVADAPSKESKMTIADNRIYCDSAPAPGATLQGIAVLALEDVFISGNDMQNVSRGITISNDVSTTGINARTTIIGNNVRAVDYALNLGNSSTTIDDLVVEANRFVTTVGDAVTAAGPTVNRATIQNNYIEAAGEGMELRGFNNSRVLNNTIKAVSNCILTQTTPVGDSLEIVGNHLTSNVDACSLGAGTHITIMDNQVRVPDARRTVVGAGDYVAARNTRGTASASPTATKAAAKGDTWANDLSVSTVVKEWVCTAAGNAGANTLKVVALA